MSNFLRLDVEKAFNVDGLVDVPQEACTLIPCKHGGVFRGGQEFVRFDTGYVHTDCLDQLVRELGNDAFLVMLARHVAIAPSKHNAGTVRQVIRALCRRIGALELELELELEQAKANAYARGAVDTSVAIAELEDEGA